MPRRPPPIGRKTLVISRTARADIEEQLDYLEATVGIEIASQFADNIDQALGRLAALGHGGVSREWISPGLRMSTLGQHCIYFRVTATETRIIRFLRGARDIGMLSFGDDDTGMLK